MGQTNFVSQENICFAYILNDLQKINQVKLNLFKSTYIIFLYVCYETGSFNIALKN